MPADQPKANQRKKQRHDSGEGYARACIARELGAKVVKHDDNTISVARQAPAFESRFYRGLSQLARDRLRPVAF